MQDYLVLFLAPPTLPIAKELSLSKVCFRGLQHLQSICTKYWLRPRREEVLTWSSRKESGIFILIQPDFYPSTYVRFCPRCINIWFHLITLWNSRNGLDSIMQRPWGQFDGLYQSRTRIYICQSPKLALNPHVKGPWIGCPTYKMASFPIMRERGTSNNCRNCVQCI